MRRGIGAGQVLSRDLMDRTGIRKARSPVVRLRTVAEGRSHRPRRRSNYEKLAAEHGHGRPSLRPNGHGSGSARISRWGGQVGGSHQKKKTPEHRLCPGRKKRAFPISAFGPRAHGRRERFASRSFGRSKSVSARLGFSMPTGLRRPTPNPLYGGARTPPRSILTMGAIRHIKVTGLGASHARMRGKEALFRGGAMAPTQGRPPPIGKNVLFLVFDPRTIGGQTSLVADLGCRAGPFVRKLRPAAWGGGTGMRAHHIAPAIRSGNFLAPAPGPREFRWTEGKMDRADKNSPGRLGSRGRFRRRP